MVAASDPSEATAPDRRDEPAERLSLWREALSSLASIATVLVLLVLTTALSHV